MTLADEIKALGGGITETDEANFRKKYGDDVFNKTLGNLGYSGYEKYKDNFVSKVPLEKAPASQPSFKTPKALADNMLSKNNNSAMDLNKKD